MTRALRLVPPNPGAVVPKVVERGYRPLFRHGRANECPGCGRSSWYVGRTLAECAFCGTAMPLARAEP